MRFILLDKVTELTPGSRIEAVKALSLAEEYLGDHFPTFPVLPGVLMIEAIVQTAAMLVHVTQEFSNSMVVLEQARNVKYKSFVKPGHVMTITAEAKSIEDGSSRFIGRGRIGETDMVEARVTLRHYNLADRDPGRAELDKQIREELKRRARLVGAC